MALLLNANDSVSRSYSITKPSPLHPIVPSECGERTEQLFDENATDTNNGYDGTGRYLTNTGTTGGNAGGTWRISEYITIEPNSEYRLSGFTTGVNPSYCLYDANKDFISGTRYGSESVLAITTPSNARYLRFSRNINTDDVTMLNAGSTALPYEPYGYKLPLTSAGQGVDIYLGEVETTRRIGKIDLGTLNWSKTSSGNFSSATTIPNIRVIGNASIGNAICDMFKEVISNDVARQPYSFSSCLNNVGRPFINKTGFEDLTVEEFKQAMSGVYMYYVLATEQTGTRNEPLRKIGNYADTIESTQTSAQIPTSEGSTTISWAGSGLAPSQFDSIQKWVDIPTYKRVNGAWVEE